MKNDPATSDVRDAPVISKKKKSKCKKKGKYFYVLSHVFSPISSPYWGTISNSGRTLPLLNLTQPQISMETQSYRAQTDGCADWCMDVS